MITLSLQNTLPALRANEYEVLATNTTLKRLYFRGLDFRCMHISDEGAKALSDALATNNTLERLEFRFIHISDEGAKAFADALATNNTSEQLDLNYNRAVCSSSAYEVIQFFVRLNMLANTHSVVRLDKGCSWTAGHFVLPTQGESRCSARADVVANKEQ